MRGSSKWQVQEVYKLSGIDRIGQPRHAAKEAAWAAGARTSTEVAQKNRSPLLPDQGGVSQGLAAVS